MRKNVFTLFGLLFMGAVLMFVGCQKENLRTEEALEELVQTGKLITYDSDVIADRYIVVFKESVKSAIAPEASYTEQQKAMEKEATRILAKSQIQAPKFDHVYSKTIQGTALTLSEKEVAKLGNDPEVKYIEQDRTITVQGGPPGGPPGGGGGGGGGSTGEQVPCGIPDVNGGTSAPPYQGVVFILDSGIDLDHEDLNVYTDPDLTFNAFSGGRDGKSLDDGNGHGTHCAGTVAAIDNEVGVIGVAPGATVVPVKVLGANGSGSYSGVIAGIDHVGAVGQSGDVANMSLGGGFSQAVNDAVIAASANVKFAIAAGNDGANASGYSPASAESNNNNIYTVAAMTCSGAWASWSNYGDNVDVIAPGVNILSTWKDGGYNTISGTSMAAPHVAGILLLNNPGSCGNFTHTASDGNQYSYDIIVHAACPN